VVSATALARLAAGPWALARLAGAPGALARLAGGRPSPTVDLYLLNACAAAAGPGGPLRRLAPTVFATDEAVLAIRHDAGAEIGPDERRRIVFLLDDAVFAGVGDPGLPLWYRAKLAALECRAARRLLPRAAALVTPNPLVAATLPRGLLAPGAEVAAIAPFWDAPFAALGHFDAPRPFRVGFSGAQTHGPALRFVAPAVAAFLDAVPDAELHLAAGHRLPAALRGRPQVRPEPATGWAAYRRAAPELARHVALYPLPDTPFARARSANKLIEHAVMGAAPLYPERWGPGRAAAAEGAGLALPDDPSAWTAALRELAAAPARARALAAGAQALARRLNDPAPQRALWARLLGVPPAALAPQDALAALQDDAPPPPAAAPGRDAERAR
jgi:hypothetical protein